MQAEILAIGSELLGFAHLDTNSLFLSRELGALGIEVAAKAVLPDTQAAVAVAIAAAMRRVSLVICTGGLGPTEDDRTVAAAAEALACPLVRDAAAARRLRSRFRRYHRPMPAENLRQALRLDPATWLPNRLGSAAGQWYADNGHILILLPGPPRELQPMFLASVRPRLAEHVPPVVRFTRVLSVAGLGESRVDEMAAPLYRRESQVHTTILATAAPQVELHFQASAPTQVAAQERADHLALRIERRLGSAVFSREQKPLAAVVGCLLRERQQTLAAAESCTGGLLAERLTAEPGASGYFLGGVVSYANAAKYSLLGVRPTTLRKHGAVSAAVAQEMAAGACTRLSADWGLAITGIAGPGGGSTRKPVGTVFIALAWRGTALRVNRFQFFDDREHIRRCSAQAALNLLRLQLLSAARQTSKAQ